MAAPERDAEFTEYVTSRSVWLRRVAFLLCGDWHHADDLVQTSITKLYTHWNRVSRFDNVDGYARRVLINSYLAEQRSPWTRWTVLRFSTPEQSQAPVDLDLSLDLRGALAALPPRQRTTIVLRYFCDLSVEETAQLMGCTTGNVKSQTSRGLTTLRATLDPSRFTFAEGIMP